MSGVDCPHRMSGFCLACYKVMVREIKHLTSRLKSAEDKIERMKALLKEIQWYDRDFNDEHSCPFCNAKLKEAEKHKPDCKLWKEIQEGK